MDITTITKAVVKFVFPFIGKNKAVQQITKDITEASNTSLLELWEWVKPIFIEEFEKDGKLDEDVENKAIVEREIKKKVNKAAEPEVAHLKALLEQLQSDEAQGKLPKTNTMTTKGDNNFSFQDVQSGSITVNTPKKTSSET